MKKVIILAITNILLWSEYQAQSNYTYSAPPSRQDGLETNDLNTLDVNSTLIYKLFNQLHQGPNKMHSVLLMKNSKLVIEEYLNGQTASQPHDLRSVSKSIISMLTGIALDKGYIDHIDDPISKYLKQPVPNKNLSPDKDKITIRHLLTMSAGWDCNDWDQHSKGQEDKVYKKKDWLQYTLDLSMVNEPGQVSNYCSMGVVLLTEIISQASDMTIQQFAKRYLFEPMGISNINWGHTLDKEVISSGKRLYLTSRDMVKIGMLILNKGRWNGIQLISSTWIEESTTAKTEITGVKYGYLWWSWPFKVGEKEISATIATGNGGQYIIILPAWDIVAVFTGGAYNSQEDKLAFAIMQDVLLSVLAD